MNASMKRLIAELRHAIADLGDSQQHVDAGTDGMTHFRTLFRASRRTNATVGSTGYRPNRDP